MMHRKIFKLDSKNKLRFWQIEQADNFYRVHSGVVNGNPAITGWKEAFPKNVGKKNETSAEDQATLEVEALYKKQLDREYHDTADTVATPKMFQPMLSLLWDGITWNGPVYAQPKLDGIRCIAKADGLWSREGQPILCVPHIWNALQPLFKDRPSLILDGELYNHAFKDDLPKINSLVRKKKVTADDLKASEIMQYHVYDMYHPDLPFKDRSAALTTLFNTHVVKPVVVVMTKFIETLEEAKEFHKKLTGLGFEGSIWRDPKGIYGLNKRDSRCVKVKDRQSAEFKVLRIVEGTGNWAGYAKSVRYLLEDGRECGAGIAGDQAFTKALLDEQHELVTIEYEKLSPDGVPLKPVAVMWHGKKRTT